MTPQPMNWTDGYGAVHAGSPPIGYWIASDDRWYPAEFHPDYVPEDVEPIEPAASPDAVGAFDQVKPTEPVEKFNPLRAVDHDDSAAPIESLVADNAFDASQPFQSVGAFDADQPFQSVGAFDADQPVESVGAFDADQPVESVGAFDTSQPFALGVSPDPLEAVDPPAPIDQHEVDAGPETFTPNLAVDPQPELLASEQPQNWTLPSTDGAAVVGTDAFAPPSDPSPVPDGSGDAPASSNRKIVTALVGFIAILGLIAAVFSLMNRGDDPSTLASSEVSDGNPTTTAAPDSSVEATTVSTSTTVASVQSIATTDDDLEGIESCNRVDEQTLEIAMTNQSEATASYLLTVAYLESDGTRVGDDTVYISSLRPGERAVEQSYVFSDSGVGCEVISSARYDRNGLDGMADISACTIREANTYGFVEADLTATNSGSTDVDYTVEVALVDADNVRRGYGTAYIGRTPVGASESGQVFTTVAFDDSYRCDVVAVTRFESAQ